MVPQKALVSSGQVSAEYDNEVAAQNPNKLQTKGALEQLLAGIGLLLHIGGDGGRLDPDRSGRGDIYRCI